MVRAAKIKGIGVPNKIIRKSRKEDCIIINEDNVLKVFLLENQAVKDTNLRIDFSKNNNLNIEDFICLGSNKVCIGHQNGLVVIIAYDYISKKWLKLYEINLNDGKTQENKLQIVCMATDAHGGFLAISTIDQNYSQENKLRQIILFRINKKYNLELFAVRDFGLGADPYSYYPYLCFDFVSGRLPVILAFQGGCRYNLDAYIVAKHNELELLHSIEKYHRSDFSAIRSEDGCVFSVDFEGNMNILTVNQ